ncbi:hypothetical protein N8933_10505 [Pseudomonadales bacterium]|nr:hypothetical protein [Pseudomonadales bacterium]
MERLTITAHMKTPFITGGGYMTFDALLAGILFDQLQDVEAAHSSVPIKCTDGLFHASAAMYEPYDQSKVTFVANLRAKHNLDSNLIMKNKNGSTHSRINESKRQKYGLVLNSYDCVNTERIEWYVEGDSEQIKRLVEPISFIGKRRASGYGEIDSWSFDESELNGLLGYLDEPLRPIPEEMYLGDTKAVRAEAGWKPAYWHPKNRAICFIPEVVV